MLQLSLIFFRNQKFLHTTKQFNMRCFERPKNWAKTEISKCFWLIAKKQKRQKSQPKFSWSLYISAQRLRIKSQRLFEQNPSNVEVFNGTGEFAVNKISDQIFTFNVSLQPTALKQKLKDPALSFVLKDLRINPNLVPNKNAKKLPNLTLETNKKWKTNLQTFGMPATENLRKKLKAKRVDRKRGQFFEKNQNYWRNCWHNVPPFMEAFKTCWEPVNCQITIYKKSGWNRRSHKAPHSENRNSSIDNPSSPIIQNLVNCCCLHGKNMRNTILV